MQEDIAELQAQKAASIEASLPPPTRQPTPEAPPPLFSPEAASELIAESLKRDQRKKLIRIGVIVGVVVLGTGAVGFAGYRWLFPRLMPSSRPPVVTLPQAPPPTAPPETPRPPQTPSAPPLPESLIAGASGVRQAELLLEPQANAEDLEQAIGEQSRITPEDRALELFPRITGDSAFPGWRSFVERFTPGLAPPEGFSDRFSILVDAKGKVLAVSVSDETLATRWLEQNGGKLSQSLDFLFPQAVRSPFSSFRPGRAIPGVRNHKFANNTEGLSIDYGFSGTVFLIASDLTTFTNLVNLVAPKTP